MHLTRRPGDRGAQRRRRRLAGPAAELAQRRGRRRRRGDLVHRPDLRPPTGLPTAARGRRVRVPLGPGHRRRRRRRRRLRPAERPCPQLDGSTLYVTDSGANQAAGSFHVDRPHHVVAFDVVAGRRLAGRRLLAVTSPGIPDGVKVDDAGRVYVSSTSGVLVHSPVGDLLGEILVPGAVNFTFGGPWATSCSSPTTPRPGPLCWPRARPPTHPTSSRLEHTHEPHPHPPHPRRRRRRARRHRRREARRRARPPRRHRRGRCQRHVAAPAPDARRAGGQLARGRRQGLHGGDLRAPEPRDRGPGVGRSARRPRPARCRRADGRDPARRRRPGRWRHRHERRDAGRGRGRLDRRRRRRPAPRRGAGARVRRGAHRRRSGRRRVGPPRRGAGCRRRRRWWGAGLRPPPRCRPGGERRRGHRQGPHGCDLPSAEQGLRGPGRRWSPVGAAPDGAVPLQGGIPLVVDGTVVGAMGVRGASSAPEDQELAMLGAGAFDARSPACRAGDRRRMDAASSSAASSSTPRATRSMPAGAPAGHRRAPRPGHRRDVRARGPGHGGHRLRRRDDRAGARRLSSSRRRSRTRSPRSAISSATSSSRSRHERPPPAETAAGPAGRRRRPAHP